LIGRAANPAQARLVTRSDQAHSKPSSSRVKTVLKPLEQFLHVESGSGLFLLLATGAALLWANSPWKASYERLWDLDLFASGVSLHFIINEALMAIFFLVVGLEIRREIHDGALSTLRTATLPLASALGGIVAPALIYIALNSDASVHHGWAIPTATDIAFAVGVLALLGSRVNPALRVLLLALAIADDIAAILIIAFFYSDGVGPTGIGMAGPAVVAILALHKAGVRFILPYLLGGAILWLGLLDAGLHPALAGVILGLLMPMAAPSAQDQLQSPPTAVRLERALHPWVAFAIMPLFALANAGVDVRGLSLESATSFSVAAGIVVGLVVGKPLGIVVAAALAVRTGLCALPPGVTWSGIVLIGCLGGIGFTMSIFIATLAFPDAHLLSAAKLAVLLASVVAGAAGLLFGAWIFPRRNERAS
jgi:NhaA family Na+:H+ antiporter